MWSQVAEGEIIAAQFTGYLPGEYNFPSWFFMFPVCKVIMMSIQL